MLKPSLCDYSDACTFVKSTVTITGEGMMQQQDKEMKEIKQYFK